MEKLKGPLMSIDARGKLADSMVFMGWKGLKTVRQHVTPANPKTQAQKDQRALMREAVALWHDTAFTEADKDALTVWAATLPATMSGFNAIVKDYVDSQVAEKTYEPLYNVEIGEPTSEGATITVESASNKTAKLYIGASKTTMLTEKTGNYEGTTWTFTLTGLASQTEYFFYVINTAEESARRTGIFKFKTAAAL